MTPLEITAAVPATDEVIQNKTVGSGMATLMILREEIDNIIKLVKSLEKYALL